jgi:integrase/recombinase XerD
MLTDHVNRYLSLRSVLGYNLRETKRDLKRFANLAESRGEEFVRTATASAWADQAPSPGSRSIRMRRIILFAKFMRAEDPRHEVPSFENYRCPYVRPLPYIYSPIEIKRLLAATAKLKKQKPQRKEMYRVLLGLIATTGLRVSEALNLKLSDINEDGVLCIRNTKFGKSRLVPLHPTVLVELNRYFKLRREWIFNHEYLFTSKVGAQLSLKTLHYTFYTLLKIAGISSDRKARPRIHDLRHTFATRALENCPKDRKQVDKNFVALSTYLGHVNIKATYWYLEATPDLMRDLASSAENFIGGPE